MDDTGNGGGAGLAVVLFSGGVSTLVGEGNDAAVNDTGAVGRSTVEISVLCCEVMSLAGVGL